MRWPFRFPRCTECGQRAGTWWRMADHGKIIGACNKHNRLVAMRLIRAAREWDRRGQ